MRRTSWVNKVMGEKGIDEYERTYRREVVVCVMRVFHWYCQPRIKERLRSDPPPRPREKKKKKRDVTYHWHICKALLSSSSRSRPHQTRLLVPWNGTTVPHPSHSLSGSHIPRGTLISITVPPNDDDGIGRSSPFDPLCSTLLLTYLLFLTTNTQAYMCELHRHENSFCLSVPRESLTQNQIWNQNCLGRGPWLTDSYTILLIHRLSPTP